LSLWPRSRLIADDMAKDFLRGGFTGGNGLPKAGEKGAISAVANSHEDAQLRGLDDTVIAEFGRKAARLKNLDVSLFAEAGLLGLSVPTSTPGNCDKSVVTCVMSRGSSASTGSRTGVCVGVTGMMGWDVKS